ncbi:hypothetical protein [Nocardioides acrostichi]|uniref:Uncharacterized protein n=1 Tax=Nocardioides acrostichi TaxID=2784339 RepID=A0A930Y6G1_9ACTN|nr:hypothetical protein [Nocardioides acrostichi]MBF4160942.1 hypothetical protein [Nocardioides acrostichi]
MSDLYIDLDALERTRHDLEHVADLLRDPVSRLADEAGAVTSISHLRSRLQDFGHEWDYGIGKLSEFSGTVGEALVHIRDAFTEVDQKLAATFDQADGR